MKIVLAVIGIAAVFVFFLFSQYNNLVAKSAAIDGQWAQVETQYQRRLDLIPNLVNATKGFLEQEKEIFTAIAEARTRYAGAPTTEEKIAAAGQVESALGRLLVIVEGYPNLRSNETVSKLMDELAGTENRIAVERGRYNTQVQEYNTMIKQAPTNITAGLFGFRERPYFRPSPGAEKAPEVQL